MVLRCWIELIKSSLILIIKQLLNKFINKFVPLYILYNAYDEVMSVCIRQCVLLMAESSGFMDPLKITKREAKTDHNENTCELVHLCKIMRSY